MTFKETGILPLLIEAAKCCPGAHAAGFSRQIAGKAGSHTVRAPVKISRQEFDFDFDKASVSTPGGQNKASESTIKCFSGC
jgi:hypothetical protein